MCTSTMAQDIRTTSLCSTSADSVVISETNTSVTYRVSATHATKAFAPGPKSKPADASRAKQEFDREFALLSHVNQHLPSVAVEMQTTTTVENAPAVVMNYGSQSLREWMESGNWNFDQALEICMHVSNHLRSLHDMEITHCNLSTDSIMLMENGEVRLANFESACFVCPKSRFGPKNYNSATFNEFTAPEVIRAYQARKQYSNYVSVDAFSFGVVLLECFFPKFHGMLKKLKPNKRAELCNLVEYVDLDQIMGASAYGEAVHNGEDAIYQRIFDYALMLLCKLPKERIFALTTFTNDAIVQGVPQDPTKTKHYRNGTSAFFSGEEKAAVAQSGKSPKKN